MEIAGFDLKNLEECGAAHFHRFDDETLNGKMVPLGLKLDLAN